MRALACLCWVRVGVESVLCAADCIAETGTRPGGPGPGWSLVTGHESQNTTRERVFKQCSELGAWILCGFKFELFQY